jgi:hypothetical protein
VLYNEWSFRWKCHEQEYAYIMNGPLDSICYEQQHA